MKETITYAKNHHLQKESPGQPYILMEIELSKAKEDQTKQDPVVISVLVIKHDLSND